MHFADGANRAGPNPFAEDTSVFGSLIADGDLSGDSGFPSDFRDAARFVNCVRERLLAKNVFAFAHGCCSDDGVKMVGGTDNDSIDVLLFVEKFAEIVIRRASFILAGALPAGVEPVDDLLRGFAAGNSAGHF